MAIINNYNKKVNNKSDFFFFINLLKAENGKTSPIQGAPDFDWELKMFVAGFEEQSVTASSNEGVLSNCKISGNSIVVIIDNPALKVGPLRAEFIANIPNDFFPDGTQHLVIPLNLGIELSSDAAADYQPPTIDLIIPEAAPVKLPSANALRIRPVTPDDVSFKIYADQAGTIDAEFNNQFYMNYLGKLYIYSDKKLFFGPGTNEPFRYEEESGRYVSTSSVSYSGLNIELDLYVQE